MIYTVNELEKFNKNNPLYTLSFYYCKRLLIEEGAAYRSVVSDRYKMIYVLSGKARVTTKERSYLLGENDCFMAAKFNEFTLGECKNTKVYLLSFSYDAPLPFFEECRFRLLEKADSLRFLLDDLCETSMLSHSLYGGPDATVLLLLQKVAQLSLGDRNQLALYQKCYDYIENHAHEGITTESVAASLGYSKDHLGRVIKACSGKSLKALIDFVRTRKLKELAKTRYSTEELAGRLGFGSAELLRKFFRYQTGQNLSDYIRQNAFKIEK